MACVGVGSVVGALLIMMIFNNCTPKYVNKNIVRNYYNTPMIRNEEKTLCILYQLTKLTPTFPDADANRDDRHITTIVYKREKQVKFYFLLTLLLSGDVATNPSPVKYPCGVCQKPIRKNQHGILCEECNNWFHIKCIQMPFDRYVFLLKSTDDWYCEKCTLPDISDSCFVLNNSISTNIESNKPELDDLPLSPESISDVNIDIFKELKEVRKRHPQQFMCSYININSYRYKYCSIIELLTSNTVDMLIVAETKLDETFPNAQFEVENYYLWREDRTAHGDCFRYENTAVIPPVRTTSHALIRSRILRENGKYVPQKSFLMRKNFFNDAKEGYFKKEKRESAPKNPMTDPNMMTDMLKGNVTNVLPMIVIGGWINWAFSGFLTTKVPFPLTLRFKPMLQRGIELVSLDASWVSSASWYFLNVFGIRSMYTLILGQDNAADQTKAMQEQMSGAGMMTPPDPNKAFKAEWEALEIVNHQWCLQGVEDELVDSHIPPETIYIKNKYA